MTNDAHGLSTLELWREKLIQLQSFYQKIRPNTKYFYLKLFIFFIFINVSCYWLAMITAFPRYVFGSSLPHYAKIQIPVGILGAVFDSLSFFVTLYLIRRAVEAKSSLRFVSHLSIDFIIAIIATWWVLFVFVISGWIINIFEGKAYEKNADGNLVVVKASSLNSEMSKEEIRKKNLDDRKNIYTQRLIDAVNNPGANVKNIYFGIVMGLSAMLPTFLHILMFLHALFRRLKYRFTMLA